MRAPRTTIRIPRGAPASETVVSASMAGYQRVAALTDVPDGGCLAVEAGGKSLVLVRRGSVVTALENRCPHAGAPLSEGFLEHRLLTCSWHGWSYDVESGVSPDDPEVRVPVFAVRVEGADIFVRP